MKILNSKLISKILLFLTILSTLYAFFYCKKDIELKEDFVAEIDYRFEKLNSTWRKRGVVNFVQKNQKNGKQNIEILNDQITKEHIEEIKSECKLGNGLYYVRIKTGTNLFFSSLNSCELVRNNFNDKLIINHFGPVKSESIISINYDTDSRYILGAIGSEEKREKKDINNSLILKSSVEFVNTVQSMGPIFPEEKPEAKGGPGAEQQSFFSKYWWVIMIVIFMLMTKGAGPEEGQSGEAAASGSSE